MREREKGGEGEERKKRKKKKRKGNHESSKGTKKKSHAKRPTRLTRIKKENNKSARVLLNKKKKGQHLSRVGAIIIIETLLHMNCIGRGNIPLALQVDCRRCRRTSSMTSRSDGIRQ